MRRRVVITGAGTINPLAGDVEATYAAFAAGRLAIGPLDLPDLERLTIRIGARVTDWDAAAVLDPATLALADRFAQFALCAADQAMRQAGFQPRQPMPETAGVVLGSAGGGLTTFDDSYRAVYQHGKSRVHPMTVPRLMHNSAASLLSIAWALAGPSLTLSTACASSNQAMGLAFQMIRSGAAPVMLTGGADAMLTFGGIKAWEGLRVMSPDGCRPFSLDRNGMVQGEGAAIFVMEDRDHALARGAAVLAEVVGYGTSSDAASMLQPSVAGAARAMQLALQDAGISAESIGYLNAHGTGTKANDQAESEAIAAIFGARSAELPVSSTKSMHGHLMGATGAVELLACLMALQRGVLAPTIGYAAADPACPLDVVPNRARSAYVDYAMSNSLAFGGINATLILRRFS